MAFFSFFASSVLFFATYSTGQEVTAPSINYQTSHILLNLHVLEHFVKGLGPGDTFNALHFIFI